MIDVMPIKQTKILKTTKKYEDIRNYDVIVKFIVDIV